MPLISPEKLNSKIEELSCKFINKHNEISVGNLEKAMHNLISWYNEKIVYEIEKIKVTGTYIETPDVKAGFELAIKEIISKLQDTLPAN